LQPSWKASPLLFLSIAVDSKVADTPTRRHAYTPTRRHAHTPTRRHADTPTRPHADTPTRRHADTPTRPHADTPTRRHAHTPTRFPRYWHFPISGRAGGEYPAREHDDASLAGGDADENAALLVDRSADGRVNGARRDDGDARVQNFVEMVV
jgi:hypothetical protein